MSLETVQKVVNARTLTAIIANGQSLSGEVDIGGAKLLGIIMPAAWDAANLTFQASSSSGGTFRDVYDDNGVEVQVAAAASRAIGVDTSALKVAPFKYIKIRSGTTASAVAQTAEREITLVLKG